MRGSVEVHAIGTDVASPSLLRVRDPLALDMMRYQRLSPDCLPLGGGGGGGPVPRKPASRTSYKDEDAPATDGSPLASYLAAAPLESKPPLRARVPQPMPPSSAGRSPARDHASDSSDNTSPSSTGGVGDVLLHWGHNKRSRCRRDGAAAAPSAQRRQPGVGGKIQRRASAPPEKLMPPPPAAGSSYTRGSNLRSASSFASRPSTAGDAGHGGGHHPPRHHHRSVEERSGGGQKRSSPDKAHKPAMEAVLHMESKNHHLHHDSPLTANGSAAGEKLGAERFELPRIYISLSRKEKEDDFLAMKGTKLPQRPKKRAKIVDKSLQFVFPGMWLSDLTKGRYEVREKKCVKKKRRGLKGMESMDSDSE